MVNKVPATIMVILYEEIAFSVKNVMLSKNRQKFLTGFFLYAMMIIA